MSKKLKIILGIIVIVLVLGIVGYFIWQGTGAKVTKDSIKFKEEYEAINAKYNSSNNKKYISINIKENNPVKYSSYDEIFEVLESGTGVIYFGFPECPWCRNLVPVLTDSALENGIKTVYYLNILEDRDIKELKTTGTGKKKKTTIVTTKEGTPEYHKLLGILADFMSEYKGLNDESIKRIYLPTVVFVKDGKILGTEDSLESYAKRVDGNAYEPMNTEEKAALAKVFKTYYTKIKK